VAAASAEAQKIDINNFGRSEAEGLAPGYTAWTFGRVTQASADFTTADGDSINITATAVPGLQGNGVMTKYWKQGVVNLGYKLLGDGFNVIELDDPTGTNNDYTNVTEGSAGIQLTIKGLKAGDHTLMAYHNCVDGYTGVLPDIKVIANGETVATDIKQTIRAEKTSEAGQSYIHFTANGTDDVVIQYISTPEDGTTYPWTGVAINALIFDEINQLMMASEPSPANLDMHVDADDGNHTISWKAAETAVKHHILTGTESGNLTEVAVLTDTTYTLSSLSNKDVCYWRIDEENADGEISQGEEWSFRPRHLAFPDAEGYGRFAQGGRWGKVVFVTNLNDDGEGSLRQAVTSGEGPRTIIFNVSGRIKLESRLPMDANVTLAGQTAPGKGICISGAPLGVGNDDICRFVRVRLGHGDTADGIGMAGANHGIVDHCSISWTIDEGFSSRNAKNITLQHTMIAEALSVAGHKNYDYGTDHGFAGSISGDIGTFHHNLLANNSGRNWSLAGGLDGAGFLQGRLDIFNNVVYNWSRQACYNGAHEVNFVNNYYKRGPATNQTNATKIMLTADPPSSKTSTQRYYFAGNIMPGVFDENNQEAGRTPHYAEEAKYDTMYYKQWVDEPFFPSYAKIETAREAFKSVLSDVGCTLPLFDDHDKRMVYETYYGKYTYKGSVTGHYGLIDSEEDCGGYEDYPEMTREEGYDSDSDGMPDWWEKLSGTDKDNADNNEDPDGDGYTNLEDFLNWMAQQHAILQPGDTITINFNDLFKGYANSPAYTYQCDGSELDIQQSADSLLNVTAAEGFAGFKTIALTVTDSEGSTMTRTFNVAATGEATGIKALKADDTNDNDCYYNLQGQKVAAPANGVYIKGKRKIIYN